jgi:hypothetical protein
VKLDSKSRDILRFRPNIDFVEPDQEPSSPHPVELPPDPISIDNIKNERIKIAKYARSVSTLARVVQSLIDDEAASVIINLDPNVDAAAVQAMRRTYGVSNTITYDHFRQCEENLRKHAEAVAKKATFSEEEMEDAREAIIRNKDVPIGGIGTAKAANGGLRPELDKRNQIVTPINLDEFQSNILKMLANFLWKNFIKKVIPLPFLPDELVSVPDSAENMVKDVNTQAAKASETGTSPTTEATGASGAPGGTVSASGIRSTKSDKPSALNTVQFQDCQAITKTYKKGCHASMTRGSAVAGLTSNLNFTQNMANTIADQMESSVKNSYERRGEEKERVSLGDAVKDTANSMITKIGDSLVPDGDVSRIFDSDCIPCGVRINFKDQTLQGPSIDVNAVIDEMLATMRAWLDRALSQIRNIIEMFKNLDQYADLCAFFNFFKDFMCIPDLYKILAILAALMMDLSFELNGVIDLAIGLIAPLFLPFLTNILDQMMKYIMLIIKPIECIIDSIQNMLSKLDYNVLFQNIERLKVGFGPKQGGPPRPEAVGKRTTDAVETVAGHFGAKIKVPYFGALSTQDPNFISADYRSRAVEFNLTPDPIEAYVADEEERIRRAEADLEAIRKASLNVDGADPEAVERYKEQERAARDEYNDAVRDRNMSAIGKANQNLEKFQNTMKGAFLQLVTFLREACLKIDSIFRSLFDELKKLLGEFAGGSGLYIDFAAKKLAIIQMIAFIKAIIEAIQKGIDCDEDEAIDTFLTRLPQQGNFKIWRDDNGDINIEEDISDVLGDFAEGDSLIEYTGDDVLDTQISQTARLLTNPASFTLGCQALTTVSDAEQVNEWIEELSSSE